MYLLYFRLFNIEVVKSFEYEHNSSYSKYLLEKEREIKLLVYKYL